VSDMHYVPPQKDANGNPVGDVLVVGTLGRGAWTISQVSPQLLPDITPSLVITGDPTADVIRLVRDANTPSLLDVFVNNNTTTPTRQVQLSVLRSIEVNGLEGNDTLTLDSSNGAIALPGPTGSIKFDGGAGDNDRLVLTGGGTASNLTGPTNGAGSVLLFK